MSKRVVVVIACLALCEIAAHAEEERPAAAGASAAELVKKVRQDEAWIHRVKSFRVVFEDRWTKPPDAVERRRAELRAQFPQAQIDEKRFRDLLPDRTGTFQIAFDDKRLHLWSRDESREEMSFWDGAVYASLTADLLTGRTNYGYAPEPRGRTLLSSMSWLRADYHRFWWSEPVNYDAFATSFGAPEQWVVTGRQDFHGVDCHVLVRRHVNSGRMYVGVADGRLHGHSVGLVIAPSKSEAIAADVAKAFGGTATTSKEFTEWAGRLEKAKRDEVYAEFSFRRFAAGFGFIEHWLLDYAAVAPGCWFPMTQGYFVYHTPRNNAEAADDAYDPESGKAPPLDARRDMKAVRVELDKPLAAALFTLGDLKEGADVFDTTRKPFLSYKYKKAMTPEEWQAIQDQAVERDDTFAKMKKAQDAVIGKPAPAFAQGGKWMNTRGPLTWGSFKGKVVVVDLFAHWCGPCRNDYPTLVQVAGQKDPNLVVLGIHVAHGADDDAKIQQLFKDFKITYPVYLDVDGGEGEMGKLAGELGVRAIPHTFTIGPDGKVAAHGTLGEALDAAYKLTRDLKK